MTKRHLFLALMVIGLALSLVPAGVPAPTVRAQDDNPLATHSVYLPQIKYWPKVREENFVTDPGWEFALLKNDPKDGSFEHSPARQTYLGHVTDNSALMAAWPEDWEASGDFMLEVDARHVGPLRKSLNGLGLAFNLEVSKDDPTKHEFYVLMIAMGAAQHFWAVVDFKDTEGTIVTNYNDDDDGTYRGAPGFMNDWDKWNQIEIRVVDGAIYALCNDLWLPGGTVEAKDAHLVNGRGIGLVLTSYEFDNGEMEFDNLRLTRLFPGDPEYEEVIARRDRVSAETIEYNAPALEVDLH